LVEQAIESVRGQLLTFFGGVFVAGALIFTARNFTLSRRALELSQRTFEENSELSRRTLELTEQGQVTDRYTKAIEQLGSVKVDVRVGGIYALERIARDSAPDHPTVMEVLATFIREHSREPWPQTPSDVDGPVVPERLTAPDVQAAVTVIARRDAGRDRRHVNLAGADLTFADLSGAPLNGANLKGAMLMWADIRNADLSGADLSAAHIDGADLRGGDLDGANLFGVSAKSTRFGGIDLSGADLSGADLSGAQLEGANLAGARFYRDARFANLTRARLKGAIMTDVDLFGCVMRAADLRDADLTGSTFGQGLREARLDGAKLVRVDLSRAKLPHDLTGIIFTGTDFTDADLKGVNITSLIRAGVDLTGVDIDHALVPDRRDVPPGWEHCSPGGAIRRRVQST
jgi:uncharacterized protein YjbI with pentapeptide repeats